MLKGTGRVDSAGSSVSHTASSLHSLSEYDDEDDAETQPTPHVPRRVVRRYEEIINYKPDGRVVLYMSRAGLLSPTSKIRGAATDSFQGRLEPTGYAWNNVSDVMKERYWKEMQNACWWDEAQITTAFVKARWTQVARMAYKDFVSTVKRKAAKGEFSKIKGVLPHVLKAWMENWKKPEVIARSEQASRNRSSGPEGPGSGPVIHHGGSRSTEKLGFDAALENDIDFEYTGIYTHMRLHRVNGVWTDPRSQRIYFCRRQYKGGFRRNVLRFLVLTKCEK